MGNAPATLSIATQRPVYQAGETVHGTVFLLVTAKDGVKAEQLVLQIFGAENTCVHYTRTHTTGSGKNRQTHTTHHYARASRSILQIGVPLANFDGGKVPPGQCVLFFLCRRSSAVYIVDSGHHCHHHHQQRRSSAVRTANTDGAACLCIFVLIMFMFSVSSSSRYEFPFEATLPPGLPSVMYCSTGRSHCGVSYGLRAALHRPGWLKWDVRAARGFGVAALPRTREAIQPVHAPPITERVNACCCINRGDMTLGAIADAGVVDRGDSLSVGLACEARLARAVVRCGTRGKGGVIVRAANRIATVRSARVRRGVVARSRASSSRSSHRGVAHSRASSSPGSSSPPSHPPPGVRATPLPSPWYRTRRRRRSRACTSRCTRSSSGRPARTRRRPTASSRSGGGRAHPARPSHGSYSSW